MNEDIYFEIRRIKSDLVNKILNIINMLLHSIKVHYKTIKESVTEGHFHSCGFVALFIVDIY